MGKLLSATGAILPGAALLLSCSQPEERFITGIGVCTSGIEPADR